MTEIATESKRVCLFGAGREKVRVYYFARKTEENEVESGVRIPNLHGGEQINVSHGGRSTWDHIAHHSAVGGQIATRASCDGVVAVDSASLNVHEMHFT